MKQIFHFPVVSDGTKGTTRLEGLSDGAIDSQSLMDGTFVPVDVMPEEEMPSPSKDWDNQEIAYFYRAQRLLGMAGISFDVDRGQSDEGDPWFVFLDDQAHVLAHFCRIDGLYYLDTTAQKTLLSAFSLEDLVNQFANRNHIVEPSRTSTQSGQVVHLSTGTNNKVRMHPGVMLAALIWSVYMMSDDLVLPIAPVDKSSDDTQGVADNGAHGVIVDDVTDHAIMDPARALDKEHLQDAAYGVAQGAHSSHQELREALNNVSFVGQVMSSQSLPASTAAGFGLTTLALYFGMHLWESEWQSAILPEDAERIAVSLVKALDADTQTEQAQSEDGAQSELIGDAGLSELDWADETIAASDEPVSEQPDETATFADAIEALDAILSGPVDIDHVEDTEIVAQATDETDQETVDDAIADSFESGVSTSNEDTVTASVDTYDNASEPLYVLAEQDIRDQLLSLEMLGHEELIELSQLTELSQLPEMALLEQIPLNTTALWEQEEVANAPNTITSDSGITFSTFDDTVYAFVTYLLDKQDGLFSATYGEEMILVDMTVLEDPSAVAYSRSWTFEDGTTLSTVGHQSEFESFGLILA